MQIALVIIAGLLATAWSLAFPIGLIGIINGYAQGKLLDELYLLILLALLGTIMEGLTKFSRNALIYEDEKTSYQSRIQKYFEGFSEKTLNVPPNKTVGHLLLEHDEAEAKLNADKAQQKIALYDIFFLTLTIPFVFLIDQALGRTLIFALTGILIFGFLTKLILIFDKSKFREEKARLSNFLIRTIQASNGADMVSTSIAQRQYERLLKKFVASLNSNKARLKIIEEIKLLFVAATLIYIVGGAAQLVILGEISIGIFSGFVIMGVRSLNTASAFIGAIFFLDFSQLKIQLRPNVSKSDFGRGAGQDITSLSVCGENISLQSSNLIMQGLSETTFSKLLDIKSNVVDPGKDIMCMSGVFVANLDSRMIATATAFSQRINIFDIVTNHGSVDEKRAEAWLKKTKLLERFVKLPEGLKTDVKSASLTLKDRALEYKLQIVAFLMGGSRILLLDIPSNSPEFQLVKTFVSNIKTMASNKTICFIKAFSTETETPEDASATFVAQLTSDGETRLKQKYKLSMIKYGLRQILPENEARIKSANGDIHTLALFLHDTNLIQSVKHIEATFPYMPECFDCDAIEEFLFNMRITYRRGFSSVKVDSHIQTPAILTQKNGQIVYFRRDEAGRLLYAKNGLNLLPMTPHTRFKGDIISLDKDNREREHNPFKKLKMSISQSSYALLAFVTIEQFFKITSLMFVSFLYIFVFPARDIELVKDGGYFFFFLSLLGSILGFSIKKRLNIYSTQIPYYAGVLSFQNAINKSRESGDASRIDLGHLQSIYRAIEADQGSVRDLIARRSILPFQLLALGLIIAMDLLTGILIISLMVVLNAVNYMKAAVDNTDSKIVEKTDSATNFIGNMLISRRAQRFTELSKRLINETNSEVNRDVNAAAYKFNSQNIQTNGSAILTTCFSLIAFTSILFGDFSSEKLGFFFFIVILINQVTPNLTGLADLLRKTQVSNQYIDRAGEIIHRPWSSLEASMFQEKRAITKVSLEKATYRSPLNVDPTLLGVTLDFEPEKVSYLYNPDREHWDQTVKILAGITNLQVGRVLINDIDASTYFNKVDLSNVVTFNFASVFPRDTIKNIITQRNIRVDKMRLANITEGLGLDLWLQRLPGGLDYRLRDFEDDQFTKSQMQMLDLARTLYSDADLKVLQDPKTLLQPRQWVVVYRELIKQAKSGKVIIIIGDDEKAGKIYPKVTKILNGLVNPN